MTQKTNKDQNITVNDDSGRFEWDIEGQTAFLLFRPIDDTSWAYTYVFVPPALRGQGHACTLTRFAMEYAGAQGKKVQAVCPFIRAYTEKNRKDFESILL